MARTVLLDTVELVGFVETCLEPYIGVVAQISDHRPLIEAVLDRYCYGRSRHDRSVADMIRTYGVPSDIIAEIDDRLNGEILRTIQKALTVVYPACHYTYSWQGSNYLAVYESDIRPVARLVEFDPENEDDEPVSADDMSPEEIRRAIDRGDYVSERHRRRAA